MLGFTEVEARDSPCAPHVDCRGVASKAEKQFGWTVPACHDESGVVTDCIAVASTRLWGHTFVMARKTEVGDLEDASVVDEDVCSCANGQSGRMQPW